MVFYNAGTICYLSGLYGDNNYSILLCISSSTAYLQHLLHWSCHLKKPLFIQILYMVSYNAGNNLLSFRLVWRQLMYSTSMVNLRQVTCDIYIVGPTIWSTTYSKYTSALVFGIECRSMGLLFSSPDPWTGHELCYFYVVCPRNCNTGWISSKLKKYF